jgi:hypothetical protein
MKIYQKCSVCGTEHESRHDWESLDEFYGAQLDEPEFEHDEGNRDCGGTISYSIKE